MVFDNITNVSDISCDEGNAIEQIEFKGINRILKMGWYFLIFVLLAFH